MGMQIPYMKAATNTLDSVVVQRPSCKQNLCLDKGYDFSEIEREVIKRRHYKYLSQRRRSNEKDKILLFSKEMGCRKNKFVGQEV
jgi:hypothetical protein